MGYQTDGNGNFVPTWDTSQNPLTIQTNKVGAAPAVNSPSPISTQTYKTFTGTVALSNSATTTSALGYTPASGKTFYVTDLSIGIIETGSNQVSRVVTIQGATGPTIMFNGVVGDKSGAACTIELSGLDTGPSLTNAGGALQILWPQLGASDAGTGIWYIGGIEE